MRIRNAVYNRFGTVDCEINHPEFGWIPFTADPNDHEPFGRDIHARALESSPAPYVAPTVVLTGANIDAERDRRVVAGVVITVAGYGDVALQGRDMDMRNLHGLATAAQLRLAVGAGAYVTTFRDRENVMHNLTQAQVLDLWSQGAAWVSLVFQSAWALKDGQSIPDDYTDDSYWP